LARFQGGNFDCEGTWLARMRQGCAKTAFLVLAAGFARVICGWHAFPNVRRRGTPGSRKTHGPPRLAARRQSGCEIRKSAVSPASRARCLRLAPHDPRWAQFSTHRFGLGQRLAVGTELRRCRQEPGAANRWQRDHAAWAAARLGVHLGTLAQPPPLIRTTDATGRVPHMDQDGGRLSPRGGGGDKSSRNCDYSPDAASGGNTHP
jgi:hypothetical protein